MTSSWSEDHAVSGQPPSISIREIALQTARNPRLIDPPKKVIKITAKEILIPDMLLKRYYVPTLSEMKIERRLRPNLRDS
jgi:hypothetical protein